MVRNALIAAGNDRGRHLLPAVLHLLDDPTPMVRGAAIWALERIDPAGFAAARASRLPAEADASVRAEWLGMAMEA